MQPVELTPEQLREAADRFGTPLYVYHAERIKDQYEKLVRAFAGADCRFFYAAKALTNIHVLDYVRQLGCNVDCSSVNEVRLAMHAGFSPDRILYTSNNISFAEIAEAKELGVHINIDSLSNLEKFGRAFGDSYPVGVRIRPNIMAGAYLKISTGHDESKFGIPIEQVKEIAELQGRTGLRIRALHIHTGSEIKDVEVFARGMELLFEVSDNFPHLEVIDLGGGFKVPYKPGEEGTDIRQLAAKVKEELDLYERKYKRRLQAWFEPGKYLVSEAGYFITRVNVIKPAGHITFAGVDSGMNHLLRPMFYGAWHTIENISNPEGRPQVYHVVGNVCETDNFAENRSLPEIREGDLLVFRNAGAYGFEMASHYNSRFRPAEVMMKEGAFKLIRRRDTLDDLLRNQAPLG